ncbi:hypothetical protein [Kineococcus radiotolerans]|uniref:hypothetical protein n=1 Tax=Kineococcus radiotolerans TaxID=131568 RepID=UPI00003A4703|nr:hypothetical protein [Kineococcus radiotolerans]
MDLNGWEDEAEFASPSGLPPAELAEVLLASTAERSSGVSAAVELLRRSGDWLEVLDAEGFIAIGPPSPRNPEPHPRSVVRWADAVAALAPEGRLTTRADFRRDPRLLRIAASLADGVPIDLAGVLGDLYGEKARLIVAAVSASTQGRFLEYELRLPDGRDAGWTGHLDVGTPYPWPEPEPAVQQPELELFPARVAEERALAWALAHPAPVVTHPLDDPVRAVLDRLRFASGMRGHGLARHFWRSEPVLAGQRVLTESEFVAWAGIEVPGITTAWAHRRICSTRDLADGHATVHWIPVDADVEGFTGEGAEEAGAPSLTIELHHDRPDPRPEPPRTRFTSAPGGWTSVTIGSSVVGVQRSDPQATRIGWVRTDLARPLAFVLDVPLLPTAAVELVLGSTGLPFAP